MSREQQRSVRRLSLADALITGLPEQAGASGRPGAGATGVVGWSGVVTGSDGAAGMTGGLTGDCGVAAGTVIVEVTMLDQKPHGSIARNFSVWSPTDGRSRPASRVAVLDVVRAAVDRAVAQRRLTLQSTVERYADGLALPDPSALLVIWRQRDLALGVVRRSSCNGPCRRARVVAFDLMRYVSLPRLNDEPAPHSAGPALDAR